MKVIFIVCLFVLFFDGKCDREDSTANETTQIEEQAVAVDSINVEKNKNEKPEMTKKEKSKSKSKAPIESGVSKEPGPIGNQGEKEPDYVPGELIVGFFEEVDAGDVLKTMGDDSDNIELVKYLGNNRILLVKVPEGKEKYYIKEWSKRSDIKYVELNGIMRAF